MNSRRSFIMRSGLFIAASTLPFNYSMFLKQERKLGVALVGLANYSTGQLGPALLETRFYELREIARAVPKRYLSGKKSAYNPIL